MIETCLGMVRFLPKIKTLPLTTVELPCGACTFVAVAKSQQAAAEGLREHRHVVHLTTIPRLRVEGEA